MSLTLYYHPLSSFCQKTLIALYEGDLAFEPRLTNLGDPGHRAELGAKWPLLKFPVLHDSAQQRDIPETSIIIEYLDRLLPPERRLIPADSDAALEVRLWDRFFDCYVNHPMQQIVGDARMDRATDRSSERAMLRTAYAMIDTRLSERRWAGGKRFSLADCAAAPSLFYATTIEAIPDGCRHAHAYFDRLFDRPTIKRVIDEARPYFDLYPLAEAIPQRFR
ncbi:glutathione S-transferase family protein [soil metagenome]